MSFSHTSYQSINTQSSSLHQTLQNLSRERVPLLPSQRTKIVQIQSVSSGQATVMNSPKVWRKMKMKMT